VQAIRGEDEFATFDDGLRCQRVLAAGTEAARTGRWVHVNGA
jgi:predicted dehydrogenase